MNNTEKKIQMAILRISKGKPTKIRSDRKLSIAAVADEAGIHRTTIINRYPALADDIRQRCDYSANKINKTDERVKTLEVALRDARAEIQRLKEMLAQAISLQAKNVLK